VRFAVTVLCCCGSYIFGNCVVGDNHIRGLIKCYTRTEIGRNVIYNHIVIYADTVCSRLEQADAPSVIVSHITLNAVIIYPYFP